MNQEDQLRRELRQRCDTLRRRFLTHDLERLAEHERAYYEQYRHDIFPDELQLLKTWVDSRKESLGLNRSLTKLLFLLVGYSKEPSLLAACLHEPEHVVCIHTGRDGTQEYAEELVWEIQEYFGETSPEIHIPDEVDGSRPEDVFNQIQTEWTKWQGTYQPQTEVVMDITGGKNTMVSGAFLAAVALGIPIYYLDFEKYDPVFRRPEPGTGYYRRFLPENLRIHLKRALEA